MYDKQVNERNGALDSEDCSEMQSGVWGNRTYDLQEKLTSELYSGDFLVDLESQELTFQRVQEVGLLDPIKIKQKNGLGLIVPESSSFGVSDICALVGGRRIIDVVNCDSQQPLEMTLREFEQYYEEKDRACRYKVDSLEFSRSRLESMVQRPNLIDYLDWIDLVWPPHLKQGNTFQNAITYPKVQRYCSMSVSGCYTDFHINFGGTSAWHYLQKGEEVLWLVPPTEGNHRLYESWLRSGRQSDIFFADMVPSSQRVALEQGNSIIIPSGWIYAAYTSKDSISFGGNFLSSFTIPMQLHVSAMEERSSCPTRLRFPFFVEIHWHVLERYVHSLTDQCFLNDELRAKVIPFQKKANPASDDKENTCKEHVHLTPFEYKGLQKLVDFLENLPKNNRNVPDGIINPSKLLKAGKDLLLTHHNDDSSLAVTGKPKAFWPELLRHNGVPKKIKHKPKPPRPPVESLQRKSSSSRVRRVRCKECEACVRDDCMDCVFCRDMRKHGGPGTMKQTCIKRRCLNPILPSTMSLQEGTTTVNSLVKPTPEPETSDKRAAEPEDAFVPMKTPKLRLEDYIDDDVFDDSMDLIPRPNPAVVVSRIPASELLKHPIRPVKLSEIESSNKATKSLLSEESKQAWTSVFRYLAQHELYSCMLACKDFLRICGAPEFWKDMNLTGKRIKPTTLQSVVRKSPRTLNLSQTNASYKQLLWLLERSPSLRSISLQGCSWSAVAALSSASSPSLKVVDLSWTSGFTDPHLKHLLATPKDCRPGQKLSHTRLRFCEELSLAGTDITDKSLKLLSQLLPNLRKLDVSFCNITNEGVGHFTSSTSKNKVLSTVVAQHCPKLSDQVLAHIARLQTIEKVDLRNCSKVNSASCRDFVNKFNNVMLVEPLYIVADTR